VFVINTQPEKLEHPSLLKATVSWSIKVQYNIDTMSCLNTPLLCITIAQAVTLHNNWVIRRESDSSRHTQTACKMSEKADVTGKE
jgi:hypothetical protein